MEKASILTDSGFTRIFLIEISLRWFCDGRPLPIPYRQESFFAKRGAYQTDCPHQKNAISLTTVELAGCYPSQRVHRGCTTCWTNSITCSAPKEYNWPELNFASKRALASAWDRAKVETQVLEWIEERYLQIETVLELDSTEWQCPVTRPHKLREINEAERLAAEVREKWCLGLDPIPGITELLEEKGLKVLTVPLPERVSGFSCLVKRLDGQADLPVIVVNNQSSLERRRLTLCHELAHRLIDTDSLSDKDEEKAANVFAGAFLMPREHLLREVGKHRNALGYKELIDLQRLYRVSGAALLMRLRQLEVISEAILIYAFQTTAGGWRTQEPHEIESPAERGQWERALRFERLCYRALAEGLISLSKGPSFCNYPCQKSKQT